MDGCVLFQFAANSGTYGPNYLVHKHLDWPDLYKACDLKEHCLEKISNPRKKENNKRFEISSNIDNIVNKTNENSENNTEINKIINLLKEESISTSNSNNSGNIFKLKKLFLFNINDKFRCAI